MKEPIKLYTKDGVRMVGTVFDGVFVKRVSAKKHFVKFPPSIATDVDVIADAIRFGAEKMVVIDTDTDETYSVNLADVGDRGFVQNRGFGDQLFIMLYDFEKSRPDDTSVQDTDESLTPHPWEVYAFRTVGESVVFSVHPLFGRQVWSEVKVRKVQTCHKCRTEKKKGERMFRPVTNDANRMVRFCTDCMNELTKGA